MRFNYVWLRDHCCDSYNSATHQRSLDPAAIELTIRPQSASVEDDRLVITCKSINIQIQILYGHSDDRLKCWD